MYHYIRIYILFDHIGNPNGAANTHIGRVMAILRNIEWVDHTNTGHKLRHNANITSSVTIITQNEK